MPVNRTRPATEALTIPGPAGGLEALLDHPKQSPGDETREVVVICHPHPVYGGRMTNKVVHVLAKAFNDFGVPAVRFNFRGAGKSAGEYDHGHGETDDALAVLQWAAQRWPGAQLSLGGFSFGGAVAIRAAIEREVSRLVTVAPAVRRVDVPADRLPTTDWLLVQGDRDELVDAQDIQRWVQTLSSPPRVALLPGVDHFFHGRLNDLREVVLDWLRGAPVA